MKSILFTALGLASFLTLLASTAYAEDEDYVPRFKASFGMLAVDFTNRAGAYGAHAYNIEAGSPLRKIRGFVAKDNSATGIITHLDGVEVEDISRLKKHHKWTTVKWLHLGNSRTYTSRIYIQPQR